VAPVEAALGRLADRETYRRLSRSVRVGDTVLLDELVSFLESIGYERREPVEMPGEFSVRGGIVDLFSPEAVRPVRWELFGDRLEELREFDSSTQRSAFPIQSTRILPVVEFPRTPELLGRLWEVREGQKLEAGVNPFPGWEFLLPLVGSFGTSVLDLLPRAVVLLEEPEALRRQALAFWEKLEAEHEAARQSREVAAAPGELYLRWPAWEARMASHPRLAMEQLAMEISRADHHVLASQPSARFHGQVRGFAEELRKRLAGGFEVLLTAASIGELKRMAEILGEYEIPYRFGTAADLGGGETLLEEKGVLVPAGGAVVLLRGDLPEGVVFPEAGLGLYGNQDLFETAALPGPRAQPRLRRAAFSTDIADLREGDYVVHVDHGIGQFAGLKQLSTDGLSAEFLQLNYLDGDRLYVPLVRLDLVQKYRSLGGVVPKLDKLGGLGWQRTKQRTGRALKAMAEELVQLYAARVTVPGYRFHPDTPWQREFEDAFEWEDTADQRTATQEVKCDMEQSRPMDRLLVGDVGFGKTEVALRAAFKAVSDSKQVAVLAPTTVLAFQHFQNFRQRFAAFPVRVEMLSRFRTRAEQKQILADLEAGQVDVLVGTHRLLSSDVRFHDLGLLVVDEEQRFGVRHKERLKQLRTHVDVLTLTATPIPRTLHMAMVGLRDLSLIETAPPARLAIQTVVAPRSPELVKTAVEHELARAGQVYFVHDRIETIAAVAEEITGLVPRARLAVAHGQLPERELEAVMLGFMRQETDVLVTTKIIENGLDIPLANTIIVDRADHFGLAELYQLRGRVGRSNRRAYAYLLVSPQEPLADLARKRLAALREFSELGAGFRIAALDLELRGAGNLLGAEQHGHVNAIGFDLYTQMLERAVAELKGEAELPEARVRLNLGVDVRIPPDYIEDERQRLRTYKKIASVEGEEAERALHQELEDRYGPLPKAVENLLLCAQLKSLGERLLLESIEQRQGEVILRFHPQTRVKPERLVAFVGENRGVRLEPDGTLRFPVHAVTTDAADRGAQPARSQRPSEEGASAWLQELRKRLLALEG
jgi:transcription-repair coupling factor (superfamily II helicase)